MGSLGMLIQLIGELLINMVYCSILGALLIGTLLGVLYLLFDFFKIKR